MTRSRCGQDSGAAAGSALEGGHDGRLDAAIREGLLDTECASSAAYKRYRADSVPEEPIAVKKRMEEAKNAWEGGAIG